MIEQARLKLCHEAGLFVIFKKFFAHLLKIYDGGLGE
jgi:hypothetical protein